MNRFSAANALSVLYLLLVSIIWPFSFGLIKNQLSGLDPTAVSVVRIGFSLLIFLPLLRPQTVSRKQMLQLFATGMVEFGVMYLLYLRAFHYLQAFEVALFTVTTPLYLAFADAIIAREWKPRHILAAVLSVAAAAVIVWKKAPTDHFWYGFLLLQLSNVCFAIGQLAYRRIRNSMTAAKDGQVFGFLYLGALVATGLTSFWTTSWAQFRPTLAQWEVLAYLGILSSGLCFFWWNRGALRVNAGTLAAMNNAKVPLGVIVSLVFFHESQQLTNPSDLARLAVGGVCLCIAVWLAESKRFFSR